MLYFKNLSSEFPLSLRIMCILKCQLLDKDFREENRQRAQGLHRVEDTREKQFPKLSLILYFHFNNSIFLMQEGKIIADFVIWWLE